MARLFIFIAACLIANGCYEGWDYSPHVDDSGTPGTTAKPTIKPIFYILFEPIYLDAAAMQNSTCFPDIGVRTFRGNEWTMRINAALTALQGIADTVVQSNTEIGVSNCTSLSTIQFRSLDTTPWVPSPAPADDPSDRPLIHLKAVFWDTEPASSPPSSVINENWAAWDGLKRGGRNAKSLLYMDNTAASNGYFTLWHDETTAHRLQATLLEPVDQTPQGEVSRQTTIDSDTKALAAWVAGQVP